MDTAIGLRRCTTSLAMLFKGCTATDQPSQAAKQSRGATARLGCTGPFDGALRLYGLLYAGAADKVSSSDHQRHRQNSVWSRRPSDSLDPSSVAGRDECWESGALLECVRDSECPVVRPSRGPSRVESQDQAEWMHEWMLCVECIVRPIFLTERVSRTDTLSVQLRLRRLAHDVTPAFCVHPARLQRSTHHIRTIHTRSSLASPVRCDGQRIIISRA